MALDKNDIQAIIAILQKGLETGDEDDTDIETFKTKKTKKTPTKKGRGKVQSDRLSDNKFLSMGVANLHKEDSNVDKVLSKSPRCPRNRKFSTIDVVCRGCGKKETINPVLLTGESDRYKCNNCSTSAG